jgi:hypothetical protein
VQRERTWVFATLALPCVLWGGACSGSAEPAGPNQACFRALDCQTGLVCVEGVCTNDIAPIVPEGAGAAPEEPSEEDETATGDAGAP